MKYYAEARFQPENRLSGLHGKVKVTGEPCVAQCYGLGAGSQARRLVQNWKLGRWYIYPGADPVEYSIAPSVSFTNLISVPFPVTLPSLDHIPSSTFRGSSLTFLVVSLVNTSATRSVSAPNVSWILVDIYIDATRSVSIVDILIVNNASATCSVSILNIPWICVNIPGGLSCQCLCHSLGFHSWRPVDPRRRQHQCHSLGFHCQCFMDPH